MALKDNIYYWEISLKNPEPIIDEYYTSDKIIIENQKFIEKVGELRRLIKTYCENLEKNGKEDTEILDEIYKIIVSTKNIQYTEFVAYWKALDMSYSVFEKLPNKKTILKTLLKRYCERRFHVYEAMSPSSIIIQALYDSGSSRKKGSAGIKKMISLAKKYFDDITEVKDLESFKEVKVGYFLPDKGGKNNKNKKLFKEFLSKYGVKYAFGKKQQDKYPDMVLKVNDQILIIEAKHIKEPGGAQDKQIVEVIEFIRYPEDNENIHYVSFVDGLYFNYFIWDKGEEGNSGKRELQKKDIEDVLRRNKKNYFVNTAGLRAIFRDLAEKTN